MKVIYDRETDSLTIMLRDERIKESDEVRPGVIADFGYDSGIVRFEILEASKVVENTREIQFAGGGKGRPDRPARHPRQRRALRPLQSGETAMRIRLDEEADAIYLRLDESRIIESEEVQPGVILDFNEHNQVVGVEILNVKARVPLADLKQIQFEVA